VNRDRDNGSCASLRPRWITGDRHAVRDVARHYRARADHTAISKNDILQNHRLCADPATVADAHAASRHGQEAWSGAIAELVITIGNIDIWPDYIPVADLYHPARINHQIAVEVIGVANTNADSGKIRVLWP